MGISNIWQNWLEAEEPYAGQAPTTDPYAQVAGQAPASPAVPTPPPGDEEDNVEDDPAEPDRGDEPDEPKDFEQWRHDFLELSIKGDVANMLDSIGAVQNNHLELTQRKFVEDNLRILLYRQEANVAKASKEIRSLIKDDLDRTNPGTTVMQHVMSVVEKDPILQEVLVKLAGFFAMKGDPHRKWLAALLGAVQVGGGGDREDLLYSDKDYTINISTRYYTQYGEVALGKWSLKADDPNRYLSEPEVERLQEGSPEEKQVLRRRIIMESISEKFKQRAFLVHIAHPDGTVDSLGWDLGESLRAAYKDGKLVVRGNESVEKDAMISDNGDIVTLVDLDILFVRETGSTDDDGKPEMVEVPFMQRRDSILTLTADIDTVRLAASTMTGMFFRQLPFSGSQSEVLSLTRCVPSLTQLLGQRCG